MQTIKRPSRNRVLTDNELAAVYNAAEKFGYPFGTIVQLCILTGQRRSETAWLRRSYFAEDRYTFPDSFTKNKRDHTFPIGKMAQAVSNRVSSAELDPNGAVRMSAFSEGLSRT
jgi:integrase